MQPFVALRLCFPKAGHSRSTDLGTCRRCAQRLSRHGSCFLPGRPRLFSYIKKPFMLFDGQLLESFQLKGFAFFNACKKYFQCSKGIPVEKFGFMNSFFTHGHIITVSEMLPWRFSTSKHLHRDMGFTHPQSADLNSLRKSSRKISVAKRGEAD